jgi:hypothetical protein
MSRAIASGKSKTYGRSENKKQRVRIPATMPIVSHMDPPPVLRVLAVAPTRKE